MAAGAAVEVGLEDYAVVHCGKGSGGEALADLAFAARTAALIAVRHAGGDCAVVPCAALVALPAAGRLHIDREPRVGLTLAAGPSLAGALKALATAGVEGLVASTPTGAKATVVIRSGELGKGTSALSAAGYSVGVRPSPLQDASLLMGGSWGGMGVVAGRSSASSFPGVWARRGAAKAPPAVRFESGHGPFVQISLPAGPQADAALRALAVPAENGHGSSDAEGWIPLGAGGSADEPLWLTALELVSGAGARGVWIFVGGFFVRVVGLALGGDLGPVASEKAAIQLSGVEGVVGAAPLDSSDAVLGQVAEGGKLKVICRSFGASPPGAVLFDAASGAGGSVDVDQAQNCVVHKLPSGADQRWRVIRMLGPSPFGEAPANGDKSEESKEAKESADSSSEAEKDKKKKKKEKDKKKKAASSSSDEDSSDERAKRKKKEAEKERERAKEKAKEKDRDRSREKDRGKDKDRDRSRKKDRSRSRDREKDRKKDDDRDRDRKRSRDREKEKDKRDRERSRDRRDREKEKARKDRRSSRSVSSKKRSPEPPRRKRGGFGFDQKQDVSANAALALQHQVIQQGLDLVLAQQAASGLPTPQSQDPEVEAFLALNPVDTGTAARFRALPVNLQRMVLLRGSLVGTRDPSAVLMSRVRDAIQSGGGPGGISAAAAGLTGGVAPTPMLPAGAMPNPEVEAFLGQNPVDFQAASRLRALPPHLQRQVLIRGSLSGVRDSSSVLMSRVRDAMAGGQGPTGVMGMAQQPAGGGLPAGTAAPPNFRPGDWICQRCNFHNYSSKLHCTQCGQPMAGGPMPGAPAGMGHLM